MKKIFDISKAVSTLQKRRLELGELNHWSFLNFLNEYENFSQTKKVLFDKDIIENKIVLSRGYNSLV